MFFYFVLRPRNSHEIKAGSADVVDINNQTKEITVRQDMNYMDKGNNRTFSFDKVFGPKSKQIDIYQSMVCPVIDEVLQGYNCTIFAYGLIFLQFSVLITGLQRALLSFS